MKTKKVFVSLMALSLMMVACGQKKDDNNNSNVSAVGTAGLPASGPSNFPMMQYNYQVAQVTGVDTNMVKAFIGAGNQINPNSVGTINPNGGVTISGNIYVDKTTGNVLQNSKIEMVVTDSYVGQPDGQGGTNQPFRFGSTFYLQQGRASNGSETLVFGDQYGTLTITGTYSGNVFNGRILFQNTSGGFNGITSGTIGNFQMQTCSFFRCM